MRTRTMTVLTFGAAVCLGVGISSADTPMGTAFTYQGYLAEAGAPADGYYDFIFVLYDGDYPSAAQVGDPILVNNEPVGNGLFTVKLDFDTGAFNGAARWLEIAVRATGDVGPHTILTPRQEVTPAPYASLGDDTLRIGGWPVDGMTPGPDQVLKWDGATWAPAVDTDTLFAAGDGLTLTGSEFTLDTAYVDTMFVGEGEANCIATGMLQNAAVMTDKLADGGVTNSKLADAAVNSGKLANGAVTPPKLADPMNLGASIWDWDFSTGQLDIDITSDFPAVDITNSDGPGYGDALYLASTSPDANTNTWVLYAETRKGNAGLFAKYTDDGDYALEVNAPASNSEGLYVYGSTVATGSKSAVIETAQGHAAIFSVESPEVEIYASGSAVLERGTAYVELDPVFTEAVSPDIEIRVTVTAVGAWSGLYVESTSPQGFLVRSGAGDAGVEFHWMACGRRQGYEVRPEVSVPDPAAFAALRAAKELQRSTDQGSN